jgi:hypothetical protein
MAYTEVGKSVMPQKSAPRNTSREPYGLVTARKGRITVQPGQQAPDLAFVRPDGTSLSLSAYAGRPLVLIFLRHLG